jgi:hypothetical protein
VTNPNRPNPGKHPEMPRLCFRVGVAGHRPKRERPLEQWSDRARRQLHDLYTGIDAALQAVWFEGGKFYARDFPQVRLVSGLAEGADQLAIEVLQERHARIADTSLGRDRRSEWSIDAILPFPRASYAEDFKSPVIDTDMVAKFDAMFRAATTVVELPDDPRIAKQELTRASDEKEYRRVRQIGYARAGSFLLRQIDILIAIWDGGHEEGPGGTAELVRNAIAVGIPVIWISTDEKVFPRLVGGIEADGRAWAAPADCRSGGLLEAVRAIVALPVAAPTHASRHGTHAGAGRRFSDFLGETWPAPSNWITYDRFKRCIERKPRRRRVPIEPFEDTYREWKSFTAKAPPAGPLGERIRTMLARRYAWADVLAVDYANKYRSAYIICYLKAAFAVFIALLGVFTHDLFSHEYGLFYKATLVAVEAVLIGQIINIVQVGRNERWQERWVEYRALAEMLRNTRFLAYLGEYGYIQKGDNLEPASSAWFLWYLRATIRELGVPKAEIDGAYQLQHLDAIRQHVISGQLTYNRDAAPGLQKMHDILHSAGDRCFLFTFYILLAFLALFGLHAFLMLAYGKSPADLLHFHYDAAACIGPPTGRCVGEMIGFMLDKMKSMVTFLAALLPAVGAAIAGIRETGDFEGFAERASRTAADLADIDREVDYAKAKLTIESTSDVLLSTARVLTEDVGAWQSVYGRKRLNLPA